MTLMRYEVSVEREEENWTILGWRKEIRRKLGKDQVCEEGSKNEEERRREKVSALKRKKIKINKLLEG